MPQKKATDQVSETARVVMTRGFAQGWSAKRIAEAVAESTGEQLAPRTVSRRAAEWRAEVERRKSLRERMSDLVAAMKAGDMDASEAIQALAMDRLMEHPEALTGSDPIKVQSLSLAAEELRLKKRQLDIRERSVVVTEKKLQILESREQRAIATLANGEDEMTPEERLKEVRAIYGLH